MAMKVVRAIAHDQRHKPASQRQLDDALTNVVWNAVLDWLGMLVVQGFRPRPSQPVWSLRMADDRVIQIAVSPGTQEFPDEVYLLHQSGAVFHGSLSKEP